MTLRYVIIFCLSILSTKKYYVIDFEIVIVFTLLLLCFYFLHFLKCLEFFMDWRLYIVH